MTENRKTETDQNAENTESTDTSLQQKSDKTVGKGPTEATKFANINEDSV